MMRKLLLSALLCSSASLAHAQITLDQSNYASYAPGDSITWDYAQTAILPTEGADQMWDYSYVQGLGIEYLYSKPQTPTPGIFPTATYMTPATYSLGTFAIDGWVYYSVDANGEYEIGNQYIGTSFPIQGGLGTLTIPDQTNTYTPKITHVQLPATYESSWSTQTRLTFDAALTITPLGMDNTPAQLVQNFTYSDEVVGWGKVKMPNKIWYDALLVKHTSMTVDSFYIGGVPPDPALLAGLGLVQADTNRTESYRFLTPSIKGDLMMFFRAGQSTQWMPSFRTGLVTTGVTDEQIAAASSLLYPNPVVGTSTLAFEKTSAAAWTVTVYNMPGQVVQSYRVDQPAGQARVEITAGSAMPAGSYRYEIRNEYGAYAGSGMMIVVK